MSEVVGSPRGRGGVPAAERTRRAIVVFRGVMRRWPDERTAQEIGATVRTVERYRRRLKRGLPFLLDVSLLRQRVAERFLELDDLRRQLEQDLEQLSVTDENRPFVLREKRELAKLELQIIDRLVDLRTLSTGGAGGGDEFDEHLARLRSLPPEAREQEVAHLVRTVRERAELTEGENGRD